MTRETRKQLDPAIHRVRIDKIMIYDITEAELESLERGSPDSLFLNFSIAVLSIAISFSAALATTKIDSIFVFTVFVVLTVVGYLAGLVLLCLWWRTHTSVKSVAKDIRGRLIPEGIQEGEGIANGG